MTGLAISPSKLFCNLSAPNVAISVYDAPLPPVLRESLSRRAGACLPREEWVY